VKQALASTAKTIQPDKSFRINTYKPCHLGKFFRFCTYKKQATRYPVLLFIGFIPGLFLFTGR